MIGWMVWIGFGILLGVGVCKYNDLKKFWIKRQTEKIDREYIEIPLKVRKR